MYSTRNNSVFLRLSKLVVTLKLSVVSGQEFGFMFIGNFDLACVLNQGQR
jgi:hypothetical protein